MNDWYQRMLPVLQLNGKGEPTQKAYTRMVRMLSEFYGKTPDLISEPELQEYFLHRKNVNRWSPKTMRICYCGIRFFYVNFLARGWHISKTVARMASQKQLRQSTPTLPINFYRSYRLEWKTKRKTRFQ